MKITESQLRKLVKEEMEQMVDEGFMDFLKGAAKPTVDAAKAAGGAVKRFAKKTWRSGKLASVAGDLETAVRIVRKLVARAEKLAQEIPDEEAKQAVSKRLSLMKGGATSMEKGAAALKQQMEE